VAGDVRHAEYYQVLCRAGIPTSEFSHGLLKFRAALNGKAILEGRGAPIID
jgi:hypothetical protein